MMRMTSAWEPPPSPGRVPPGRHWYVVAALIFVAALVPIVPVGSGLLESARNFDIVQVSDGSVITVADKQKAFFFYLPGAVRPAPGAYCELTPVGGGDTIELIRPSTELIVNNWQRIAVTPRGMAPGDYSLNCPNTFPIPVGVEDNPAAAKGVLTLIALVTFVILGILAASIIAIFVAVKRSLATGPPTP